MLPILAGKLFQGFGLNKNRQLPFSTSQNPNHFNSGCFLTYRLQVCEVQNISSDNKEYANSDNNSSIMCFSQTLIFCCQLVALAFRSDCRTGSVSYTRPEHLPQFSRGLNSIKSIKTDCYKIDWPTYKSGFLYAGTLKQTAIHFK